MDNLGQDIKSRVDKALTSDIVSELIEQHIQKSIEKIIGELFNDYGGLTHKLKQKIEALMIPQIENYDYSRFILKMDSVLADLVTQTTKDHNKMLENFKEAMTVTEEIKEINMEQIFDEYCKFAAKYVDGNNLKVDEDACEPRYEDIIVSYEMEDNGTRDWSSFEYGVVNFECEEDDDLNFQITIRRYKPDSYWRLNYEKTTDIRSLRYLKSFELFLMKLDQERTKITIDSDAESREVEPEAEPDYYLE